MTAGATDANHIPAIDGLRAVAVAAVLVFHADLGIADGGFLGVSLFFTLSGYLITTLLLREYDASGTISIRSFYGRRWRRLVPSAWLCITVVLAAAPLWSVPQVRALPGDAWAALGNVANWRAAFADLSYQDIFIGRPSPLAHFWSLAIEEQFYAVMPLIALVALRRSKRTLSIVAGTLIVASVVVTALTSDRDLIYNGTHTRAAELLIGVLLAIHAPVLRRFTREVIGWIAFAGFVAIVALSSIGDDWIYRGGLAAFALISAALVVAAIGAERSVFTTVFGARPLVAVGRWSYALYLIHWPIYLALDADRTHLRPVPLFAVRTVLAVALAALITTVVERPIRTRRVLAAANRTVMASVVAATCLVVAIVALPRPALSENDQLLAAGESGEIIFSDESNGSIYATTTTTAPPIPVLVVGSDSAAVDLLRARGLTVIDGTNRYCPIVQAIDTRLPDGEVVNIAGCTDATSSWVAMARESDVVDVVISFGAIDEGVTRTSDDDGFPDDMADLGGRWDRVYKNVKRVWDSFPSNFRLHLLHQGSEMGWLVDGLTRFAAEGPGLSALHASVDSLSVAITAARTDGTDIPRVLVVGDSTSVRLAVALFRASAGQLEVRWVGANGCPFVDAVSIRPSLDDPWEPLWCPSNIELVREQLDTYVPDVVVLMVAPAELGYQKYNGDDRSHVAGDPTFTQIHDGHMEAFIAPLSERGTTLLVADCPQMRANDFTRATDEMMSPERIASWNAQVQRWVDSSPDIALLPYAAAINEYESTIGEVLHDGMHPDVDILTEIMPGQLLDVILAAARRN
ncbi:MAG: acyltransferase [Ilumatobacteraceae bacterium]